MRDKNEHKRERLDAAKAAAPYCHARLSATELSGKDEGPVQFENVSEEARLEAFMAFLAKTKCRMEKKV
jgi:hypothetical protein